MNDVELLGRFESQSLTCADWTHRLHVRMAYLYLRDYPFDQALDRIRAGIQRLNASNHVHEGPQAGYNETVTVAWVRIIHTLLLEHSAAATSDDFVDANSMLLCSRLLRLFYSRAIWTEQDCQTQFVEPDLTPLPRSRTVAISRAST
jgi:hypothetical protein